MATVSPVGFGVVTPRYSQTSSNKHKPASNPVATQAGSSQVAEIPNQKSALAVLLTSAVLCTVAIVNLIKAGR